MNKILPINIDPEIMSGAPVFRGTRVTIQTLFDYIEGDHPLDDFLEGFPSVSREPVLEVLELAKRTITSEKMLRLVEKENV
jgi:uncharacterized protein (DUF433 family)